MALVCRKCNKSSNEVEFIKYRHSQTGYRNLCKPCGRLIDRVWRETNKDKKKEKDKAYQRANLDVFAKRNRKWRQENPDKVRTLSRRGAHIRRSKLKGGGSYTEKEWQALCKLYDYLCLSCYKSSLPLTVDHVVPIVLGGSNAIDNLQPLCKPCNNKKYTKIQDFKYWYGVLGV